MYLILSTEEYIYICKETGAYDYWHIFFIMNVMITNAVCL